MSICECVHRDEGAIAVLYTVVFAFVLMPLMALGTTTLVRTTTSGELQRAADAGALAGAAEIPFGDINFARNFLAATTGGSTNETLTDLGLSYPYEDPLQVACQDVALPNATDQHNVGANYASGATCTRSYVSDPDTLRALQSCANGLTVGTPLPGLPDLSPLLPALLYPGVQVTMSWRVKGPLDQLVNGNGPIETVTAIAHRRFKNLVVIPEASLPTGTTINLNPYVGDVRNATLDALQGTEQLLSSNPVTSSCAGVLDAAHDDILDAIDPPNGGPDAQQVLADSFSTRTPLLIAQLATASGIPYLDFAPVCVDYAGDHFVGHLTDFGSCSLTAPGGFRASLRRS